MKMIKTPTTLLYYKGREINEGPLPALFYFSLSGEESLELAPYNHLPQKLENEKMRIFSMTLPGHGEGFDKFHALSYWANKIKQGETLIEEFVERANEALVWLIEEGIVDPSCVAVSGLSRGGLIATLLAAKNTYIKTVVAFAPVVDLSVLEDFSDFKDHPLLLHALERIKLLSHIEALTHLTHLRFYIATLDERVHSDSCYHFIRALSKKVQEKRARHCKVELFLTSPLGHKGHGTAPHIFDEGALLIKQRLINYEH